MKNFFKSSNSGFTLVEVVVYASLTAVFSTIFLLNLRSYSTNASVLERASAAVISDFRRAQNRAIAGADFQGSSICGYGLHYLSSDSYLIYAGGGSTCSSANRNYQNGQDFDVQTVKIVENNIKFKSSFNDIFFEPPDPKTYLNNKT